MRRLCKQLKMIVFFLMTKNFVYNIKLKQEMDNVFIECVKEIEYHYVAFPKVFRFRIEKWVEKLALAADSNPTWRKHRDCYVKLLLSMVMMKKLEDPFDKLPPSGPLSSFPADKMLKLKSVVGARESIFWRDLYDVLSNKEPNNNKPASNISYKTTKKSTMVPGDDVQHLNLIIREQTNRIQMLEEKLRDERVNYELQLKQVIQKYETALQQMQHQPSQSSYSSNTNYKTNTPLNPSSQAFLPRPETATHQVNANISVPYSTPLSHTQTPQALSGASPTGTTHQSKQGKKEVLTDYMRYLDRFQDDLKAFI